MPEFLAQNWFLILVLIAAVAVGGYFIYVFVKMPSTAQMSKVKEWLLYAVAEAERELGGGTGQLKLRYVYDMFIVKFPYLVKLISFEAFSLLVDEVLEKFKDILNTNVSVQNYVAGGQSNEP